LTPWISEQVAKQANPTGFSPSRRRFLKGTGAAAAGTATGIPVWKQVAKTVPDAFGGLMAKMSSTVGSIGVKGTVVAGMNRFSRRFQDLAEHLVDVRWHRENMIDVEAAHHPRAKKIRQFREEHPVKETGKGGDYYAGTDKELTAMQNSIRDRVKQEDAQIEYGRGHSPNRLHSGAVRFDHMDTAFGHVERAKTHYEADPKGFILALEDKIKVLKRKEKDYDDYSDLVYSLEDFLKELKAQ